MGGEGSKNSSRWKKLNRGLGKALEATGCEEVRKQSTTGSRPSLSGSWVEGGGEKSLARGIYPVSTRGTDSTWGVKQARVMYKG